jgi:hypothetical protein
MAKSKTKRASIAATPYLRRAVEDEYAQQQLRNAASRLRDVYGRISRQQAAATEDKRLYRSLKEAAVSVRKAVGRIEEPPKPKHTMRNTLLIGAAAGAAFLLFKRSQKDRSDLPQDAGSEHAAEAGAASSQPASAPAPA